MATAVFAGTCPDHGDCLCVVGDGVVGDGSHSTLAHSELKEMTDAEASDWLHAAGEEGAIEILETAAFHYQVRLG